MKAIIWTAYGSPEVLHLRDVPKPTPNDHEILIKVHAANVTTGDCEMRSLRFPVWIALPIRLYAGILKPSRIVGLGQDLAGEIEAVGKAVKRFKVGDQVFGTTGFAFGAYAEYVCLPEDTPLAIKPSNLSYEQAATVPTGGLEALHFIRKAELQRGHHILIYGAGGGIGTIAVQLAKHTGAEITAVDSGGKLDMLRSLGAEHVVDYTREDFTQNGQTYDVILDVVGKSSFSRSLNSVKPDGRYLLANPKLSQMLGASWASQRSGKRVIVGAAKQSTEGLDFLRSQFEADALQVVIDRRYPLEQTADAHRYVESGQKKGNVIVTMAHPS